MPRTFCGGIRHELHLTSGGLSNSLGCMPDNTRITGPQDPQTINLSQKHEIDYWTRALSTTETKLRAAVAEVGNNVEDVKEYLRNNP